MIHIENWESIGHYATKEMKSKYGDNVRVAIFAIDDTGDEVIIKADLYADGYAEYLNCMPDGTINMGFKGWDESNQNEWHDQDSKIDTIGKQDLKIFAEWLVDYALNFDLNEAKRYYPVE